MCPINKQPITEQEISIWTNKKVRNIFETEVLTCMLTCTEQKKSLKRPEYKRIYDLSQ